jgi:hypothetical protein
LYAGQNTGGFDDRTTLECAIGDTERGECCGQNDGGGWIAVLQSEAALPPRLIAQRIVDPIAGGIPRTRMDKANTTNWDSHPRHE